MSLDALRQSIRRRRRQLGIGTRVRAAHELAKKITELSIYQQSRHVAFYLAVDGELSCQPLIKQSWRDHKKCYLPVLRPRSMRPPMHFLSYLPGGALAKSRYKIFEPVAGRSLPAQSLDLVIVPLVACDSAGNRIGMGGGYYDKTFEFKNFAQLTTVKNGPWLLGVGFRHQLIGNVKPQSWDVGLDQILLV